jgi:hypothetical protein
MTRKLDRLLDAARVIQLTPAIRDFLQRNDPKALEQLERAIGAAEECDPRRPLRRDQRESRQSWLLARVDEQRTWIAQCGGDLAGYIRHYGDPGLERCYGDGGTAIYRADMAELERLERDAGIRS